MTIDREVRLGDALRALAQDDARRTTPAAIEAQLVGEVRRLARRRQTGIRRAAALAVAATIVAAAATEWRWHRTASPVSIPAAGEVTTAFLPLPYARVPVSNGAIVRLRLPRTALASFGLLSPDAADAASGLMITADVIVGDDGLARAVRFVRAPVHKE